MSSWRSPTWKTGELHNEEEIKDGIRLQVPWRTRSFPCLGGSAFKNKGVQALYWTRSYRVHALTAPR